MLTYETSLDPEFKERFEEGAKLLQEKYTSLYGETKENYENLVGIIEAAFQGRKKDLRLQDNQRSRQPQWYMSEKLVGMSIYVDLFADNLTGVKDKIEYFKELGITYIHFMPVLKTRDGKDDGGFAVSSYKEINPKLGNMSEFEDLVDALRKEGIVTCIDFVLNHTAKEHEWVLEAMNGNEKYQQMYYMFDTYDIPREFEKTLPLIFPEVSQQNFIYSDELKKWVCSIFYEYQWDLNYKNPVLFNNIAESMLFLLNQGVDILRLDAIPHIWKEVGTDCFNLPQVHEILSMLNIIVDMVAPGSIFKGEAIGSTESIMGFFGDKYNGCSLMYNFPLSVSLWNALVTEDTREMQITLDRLNEYEKNRCFINYIRCHDDIAWDMDGETLRQLGIDSTAHFEYVTDFYLGKIPGSFSKAESKDFDSKAKEGRKTSGTVASLCGLEKAVEDANELQTDLAIKKILLLHSIILSYEGIPMLYGGDEIGMFNDPSYKDSWEKADDSRWLHRVSLDWARAEKRGDGETIEGRIFQSLKKLITARKSNPLFNSSLHTKFLETGNQSVFGYCKKNQTDELLVLCNFSGENQKINSKIMNSEGLRRELCNMVTGEIISLNEHSLTLQPYEFMWLT